MLQYNTSRPALNRSDDNRSLSGLFDDMLHRHAGQTVKIGTLLEAMHERGFGVLLIFFALPLCIPIPKPPPIDTILGIPLFYLCAQMIMGRDVPLLPHKVTDRKISVDLLLSAFNRAHKWLVRLERLFHPRLTNIHERQMTRICGVIGMVCTLSVLVPIPFSNTIPSICVALMAMGLVMRDNLAALLGGLAGVLWVLALAGVLIFGATYILDGMGSMFK